MISLSCYHDLNVDKPYGKMCTAFHINIPISICPQTALYFSTPNLYRKMIESPSIIRTITLRVIAHFIDEKADVHRG